MITFIMAYRASDMRGIRRKIVDRCICSLTNHSLLAANFCQIELGIDSSLPHEDLLRSLVVSLLARAAV